MTGALNWLTPEITQALGWTLVHFLWQGTAIAALLYMALAFCRGALVRYNFALAAFVLMAACPAVTFFVLYGGSVQAAHASPFANNLSALTNSTDVLSRSQAGSTPLASAQSVDWLSWFVWTWLAGVLVFGVRALGGWMVIERLRREKTQAISAALRQRCLLLQRHLGLSRSVRYLESRLMDSPAVVGWFRPVVLLPVTALTGLSREQLEAVIVHELAHIKRFDCFVNLFQIAVEAVLFYHPAIWWVSRSVRTERENCCDDTAVAVCGDVRAYATALTLMEGWRATPALVLAAAGGSLKSRISRLLGLRSMTHSIPRGGLAAIGVLCTAGALLAGTTFHLKFAHTSEPDLMPAYSEQQSTTPASPAVTDVTAPAPAPRPATARIHPEKLVASAAPVPREPDSEVAQQSQDASRTPPAPPAPPEPGGSQSYIDEIRSAGLTNISVDDLIALKIQGVTPDYIRKIRAQWSDVSIHDLIAMRVQGIQPSDLAQYRQSGLKDISLHQLIALKAVGVTPEYIRAMQAAGFSHLSTHEYLSAKALGITPEFIQKAHAHGFSNLTMRQLIGLKIANVF